MGEWLPLIYAGVVNPGQVHLSPGLTRYIWREVAEGGREREGGSERGKKVEMKKRRARKRVGSHRAELV